jgi:O-antigen/teichoic acid export membrane protein
MKADGGKNITVNRLLRSTVSNYIGRIVELAAWFLLTPYILQQLQPSLYGLWVLVGTVVAYGALLEFGIAGAVTKYVAEYQAKGQLEEARNIIATSLALYSVLGLTVTLAGLALAPLFPRLFNVPAEFSRTAVWLVMLSGMSTGLAILSASATSVLRGLQRFDVMNLLGIVTTLLSAGAIVTVLALGGGVIGLVSVRIAVNLLMQIPAVWFIYRIAPELRFGLARPSREMLRAITSFSSSLFLIQIGGQLETKTDEIVVGGFLPVSAVTPYSLVRKLSALPQMLTEQFLSIILPLASELHADDDQARLRSLYIISTRLTLGTFSAIGISLVVLAGPILTVWVGKEYADYAYLVFVLMLASFIDIPTWPAGSVLQGIARHRFLAILSLCSGIANLTLSLLLVRPLGLLGVALGTLIPTTVICLGFTLPYAMREIGVTFQQMLERAVLPALAPIVPASAVTYLLRELLVPTTVLPTLIIAAVGSLLYVVGYLGVASSRFERDLLHETIVRTVGHLREIRTGPREEIR